VAPGGPPQDLLTDLAQLGGCGSAVVELDDGKAAAQAGPGVVRVGVDRAGRLPAVDADAFDVLLTRRPAPAPWVHVADADAAVAALQAQIALKPVASAVCAQVLRATLQLSFDEALALESLAYSMLLASGEFRAWRAATPPRPPAETGATRVLIEDDGPGLAIVLNRPERRNAVDAAMRDALTEALAFALQHPDAPPVTLRGAGPAFSAGGDLDEFGTAGDVGAAHLIRTLRSPARLAHQLGERLTARLHGACVGAGIEVPAAATRVTATPGAWFRLPEVSMGLIPGAGGTASIPRRIGRHRAAWMALSGADIDLPTALAWGLVDAEAPAP
jgi:enoyl-CoA hydratase/carnithine racemase